MGAHDEMQETSKGNVEDVGTKNCRAIARSKALQHAVSQGVRQAQLHLQQAQQPSIVRWDRFLPQKQLHVLLVEDDDSTRHVVTALLRNCGYEVTFAANGLRAWELLMDQTNPFDLVLTEVVMPGLSGIGLLTRIMNHEPLKHIPVIMMSSHDSMGVVFKCLSKGAVDFLVKPVRKNELKNLWQHIWRRCHSSSGSGTGSASGSGSPTQKVPQPDTAAEADNAGSSDESDNMSSELNLEGGSDNGSGTQSSWTKKAVEVKSPREGIAGGSAPCSSIQSKNGCLLGDVSLDANIAHSRFTVEELPFFDKNQADLNQSSDIIRVTDPNARDTCFNQQILDVVNEILTRGQNSADEQMEDNEDADGLLEKHASNSPSSKDRTLSDSSSPLLLKLSLKRPSQAENDTEREVKRGLQQSCSSAFSRYNNTGNNAPFLTVYIPTKMNLPSSKHGSSVGKSLPPSRPFSNIGTDEVVASPFFGGISHCSGNQSSSVVHTYQPGKHGVTLGFAKEDAHTSACPGMQMHSPPTPGMPNALASCKDPISADPNLTSQWGPSLENIEAREFHVTFEPSQAHQTMQTNHDTRVHHHSHHHHHHHHHIQHHYHHHQDQYQQRPKTPQQEDSTVVNVGLSAPRCGSSNMEMTLEGNTRPSGSCNGHGSNGNGAVSLNGSATGSNYRSNGDHSAAAEPGNLDSNSQIGVGGGLAAAHGFLMGADESRHARREAALTKFRQKRKERCFEKKVRYQSRKRLAEQRPRVRGQFVRRSVK